MEGSRNKQPQVKTQFVRGAALTPAAALRSWLDAHTERLLRAPVEIERGGLGEPRRARLGELEVQLDDSALGVSLDDRLRSGCGEVKSCVVWLEVKWSAGTLRVFHFEGAVKDGEAADFVAAAR